MARRHAVVTGTLGIVDVGRECAHQRAASLDLFELVGGWVADTDDPALQRLYATAAHRHAWHAELWAQRAPAIPPVTALVAAPRAAPAAIDRGLRREHYAGALARLGADLTDLRSRIDAVLDPSTTRTIDLVERDIAELSSLIAA